MVVHPEALNAGEGGGTVACVRRGHDEYTGEQAGHLTYPASLGFIDAAGEMALAHVGDLVPHNRGKFILGASIEEETSIDPYDPARCREGIDFLAVDDDERKTLVLQLATGGQLVGDVLQVGVQQGIGNGRCAAAQLGQELLAHLVFLVQADRPGNTVPEAGEGVLRENGGSYRQGNRQQGQAEQSGYKLRSLHSCVHYMDRDPD